MAKKKKKKQTKKKQAKKKTTKKKSAKKQARKKRVTRQKTAKKQEPSPKKRSREDVYKLYEQGLRLLHEEKYKKASELFAQVIEDFPAETEVRARAKSFLRTCQRHLQAQKESPDTAEGIFNRAVLHHNASEFDQALDLYSRALKLSKKKKNDHVYYALAATELALGNTDNALKHLQKAIELNEDNRFFAQNDPDFESLTTNQQFRKLVFSE